MIDKLFAFPIIMIDVETEEKKQQRREDLALPGEEEEEYDMVEGEAEYPYYDFIGIEDRWLPNKESLKEAMEGKFNACVVKFANVPQLLVPWTKSKFKRELSKFIKAYNAQRENDTTVIKITPEQLTQIQNVIAKKPDEENE